MADTLLHRLRKCQGEELTAFLDRELARLTHLKARERLALRALIELAPDLETWSGRQAEITDQANRRVTPPVSVETIRRGIRGLKKLGLLQMPHENGTFATYVVVWRTLLADPQPLPEGVSAEPRPRQLLLDDVSPASPAQATPAAARPAELANVEVPAASALSGLASLCLVLARGVARLPATLRSAAGDRGQPRSTAVSSFTACSGDRGQAPPTAATDRGHLPPENAAEFGGDHGHPPPSRAAPHEMGFKQNPTLPQGVGVGGGADGVSEMRERPTAAPPAAAARAQGPRPRGVGAYGLEFPPGFRLAKGLQQTDLSQPHRLDELFRIAVQWECVTDDEDGRRLFWALARFVWRRRQTPTKPKGFRNPLGMFTAFLTLANLARSEHQQPWWEQVPNEDEEWARRAIAEWQGAAVRREREQLAQLDAAAAAEDERRRRQDRARQMRELWRQGQQQPTAGVST